MEFNDKSVDEFEDTFVKIENFIDMVIKDQISWKTLSIILDEMTKTFEESKQMVKILIQILQSKLVGNFRETSNKETQTNIVQNLTENQLNTENSTNYKNYSTHDFISENHDQPLEKESIESDLASENVESESNIDQDFTENFNKVSQTDLIDIEFNESNNFKIEIKEALLEPDLTSENAESEEGIYGDHEQDEERKSYKEENEEGEEEEEEATPS